MQKSCAMLQLQSFFPRPDGAICSGMLMMKCMSYARRELAQSYLWSILSGLGIGVPFIYVVWAAMNGIYTLGDLALYAGIVLQVRRSLFLLIVGASEIHEAALGTSPIPQPSEFEGFYARPLRARVSRQNSVRHRNPKSFLHIPSQREACTEGNQSDNWTR